LLLNAVLWIKDCEVGCIGCGKCVKVCNFDAITMENNLAKIDPIKCRNCGLCVPECPTGAIVSFKPIKKRAPKKTPEELAELKAKAEAAKKAKEEKEKSEA
jgi:ferredoxin